MQIEMWSDFNMNPLLVVVAEVTQPSLGVGYELGRAKAMNKKILCLFRPKSGRSKFFWQLHLWKHCLHYIRIQIISDRNQLYKFSILQLNDGLGPQKYAYSK